MHIQPITAPAIETLVTCQLDPGQPLDAFQLGYFINYLEAATGNNDLDQAPIAVCDQWGRRAGGVRLVAERQCDGMLTYTLMLDMQQP